MKIFFRRIHLYLSLAAGLVILAACLTGAVLVFEKDLQTSLNKERYYVEQAGEPLPATQLVYAVTKSFPGSKITGIKLYADRTRSAEINITAPPENSKTNKGTPATQNIKTARPAGERQPGYTVFVNPYTGAILDKYSYRETFFYQVFALHRWLLGGNDSIGKYIVGWATAMFLFIIITGLVLWWPKTKRVLLKRLQIKKDATWKRFNHDLHLVLGFYSSILLFIFAFTGLAWSFEWFNEGIYTVTSSPMKPPPPPKSVPVTQGKMVSIDAALVTAKSLYSNAVSYSIVMPKEPTDALSVSVLPQKALHESATDAVYIDQWSGAVLGKLPFENRSLGAQVRATFKPVHTGSIWGLPSKIVAFIVCLFGASLPITGTIMWLNRTRKKKRRVIVPSDATAVTA